MTLTSTEMNVQGAFELLIESLEEEVNGINHTGAAAFERGDYPAVDTMRTRVDAITALREKVLALRNEWENIMPPPEDEAKEDGGINISACSSRRNSTCTTTSIGSGST